MNELFGILSFMVSIAAAIPYIISVHRGDVTLARSTRFLLSILVATLLVIQVRESISWASGFIAAEMIVQIVLAVMSIGHGKGGVARLDIVAYSLFSVAFATYLLSSRPVLSIVLLIITDLVAFTPTLVKNWHDPSSDSPMYYSFAVFASMLSVAAASTIADPVQSAFPAYLVVINLVALTPLIKLRN